MTDPATTPRPDLAARYGRTTSGGRRRLWIVAAAALAAAGLAWLLWVAVIHASPPVASRLTGFDPPTETSVVARFEVERNEDVDASCRVQAKAADFSIVGETTVRVAASSPRHQLLTARISTQREATSVVLVGCTTAGSSRPR